MITLSTAIYFRDSSLNIFQITKVQYPHTNLRIRQNCFVQNNKLHINLHKFCRKWDILQRLFLWALITLSCRSGCFMLGRKGFESCFPSLKERMHSPLYSFQIFELSTQKWFLLMYWLLRVAFIWLNQRYSNESPTKIWWHFDEFQQACSSSKLDSRSM